MVPAGERAAAEPLRAVRAGQGGDQPWAVADKPPIAVVGSGPAGLINAHLLTKAGFPVTVFEAFHTLAVCCATAFPSSPAQHPDR